MSTQNEIKLKKMLDKHIADTVCLAPWLERMNISRDLQKRYKKSGWLETIGPGAYKRPADTIDWQGGLYTLQKQANLRVHAGALTALSMQGYAHFLRLGEAPVFLFSPPKMTLPSWFRSYNWGSPINHTRTSMLPLHMALSEQDYKTFSIKISAPERAILECLYLAPLATDLVECFHLMEGLANLRPNRVQELLEACCSIKVKRLFLYMADKAGHQWLEFIDQERLNLGKGDRSLVKGGVYIGRYKISIPSELAQS